MCEFFHLKRFLKRRKSEKWRIINIMHLIFACNYQQWIYCFYGIDGVSLNSEHMHFIPYMLQTLLSIHFDIQIFAILVNICSLLLNNVWIRVITKGSNYILFVRVNLMRQIIIIIKKKSIIIFTNVYSRIFFLKKALF